MPLCSSFALEPTFATGIPQHSSCSKGHSRQSRKMQPLQLCTNAVRKTKSQDKVAFWRLLTSSRQSRPADSLTLSHGWKRLADKYPDVGSSFLHKVKRVASKRRKATVNATKLHLHSFDLELKSLVHIFNKKNALTFSGLSRN